MHAKRWILVSPKGERFEFRNLQHFVRERPELFLPRDVIWKRGTHSEYCNATAGISNMRAGRAKTYKGWTLLIETARATRNSAPGVTQVCTLPALWLSHSVGRSSSILPKSQCLRPRFRYLLTG